MLKKILLPTTVILTVILFTFILIPNNKDKDLFSAEDVFGKEVVSFNENAATVKLFKRTNKQGIMLETSEIILSKETQQKLTNSIIQSKFEKATTTYWNLDYSIFFRTGDSIIIFYFDSVNKIINVLDGKKMVSYYYKIKDSGDDSDEFFTILEEFIK